MYYIFYNNNDLIFVNVLLILDDQTCKLFYNQNYKYCSSPFIYNKIMKLIAAYFSIVYFSIITVNFYFIFYVKIE